MVDRNHNNQTEQEPPASELTGGVRPGSISAVHLMPADLESSEQTTMHLLDALPSVLPTDEVDSLILQQAALAVDSSLADESKLAQVQKPTVVPLYNHEREVSFRQVFPKVFVAAAVVVLAVVVVPLVDRMGFSGLTNPSLQTVSSSSVDQNAVLSADQNTEQAVATSLMESDDTDALAESAVEVEASSESLPVQADVSVPASVPMPVAEVVENPFSEELALAAESDAGATEALGNDANEELSAAKSVSSQADDSVVAGVTRTTIISTETSATPSVVQSISISSAARVQRKVEVEDVESVDDASEEVVAGSVGATLSENQTQKSSANFAAFQASNSEESKVTETTRNERAASELELESVTPAYRRSLHRWKAEILKLSRLGKQQQAQVEYRLYINEHPQHAIVFNQSALSTSAPNAAPSDENIEETPVLIEPAENTLSPEK